MAPGLALTPATKALSAANEDVGPATWLGAGMRLRRRSREARLRHHARLTSVRDGDVPLAVNIGPRDELMVLWTSTTDRDAMSASTTQPGWATFPEPLASRPASIRAVMQTPGIDQVISLRDVPVAHVDAQPMPDGGVLLVGARARWRPDGPDQNGLVFDANGDLVVKATLGDGIEHVQATTTGEIWVGYFDEGVYGNFGWGGPDGPEPFGSCGLIRFGKDLTVAWTFAAQEDGPAGAISDCYALNVKDQAVWACYYTGFPLVRVSNDAVAGWNNATSGSTALITNGTTLALVGWYRDDYDLVTGGLLDEREFNTSMRSRLVLPNGMPLPPRATVIGRGTELHVVAHDAWYRLSLDDLDI
jgi:hypothetical protein